MAKGLGENTFILEGEKLIAEIPEHYKVQRYFFSQSFAEARGISQGVPFYNHKAPYEIIRDNKFKSLADTVTPQGVLAVCEKIPYTLDDILGARGFILLCERINDPGNAGTLIRTAAAAGASGVIFTRGSCNAFSPKVIRAAAGAALRLPIVENASGIFDTLKAANIPIYAAHPRGGVLPYELDLRQRFCLLLGSEAHGISQEAEQRADMLVRLPMTCDTESLNVSVAGSILMYEAVRQGVG
ncbi:MAG: RNA methyltransferase [Defluviitaleaceae bacterium]|nr:RNA methyltransferase [Defluviitaleaceae bacterium]